MRPILSLLALICAASLLSGCEQLGIETPAATAAKREADSKAVGGACRHAGRAIEDCYTLYQKSDKAAIYTGWREMDAYMRENKIEPVPATLPPPQPAKKAAPPPPPPSAASAPADDAEASTDAEAPAAKGGGKGH